MWKITFIDGTEVKGSTKEDLAHNVLDKFQGSPFIPMAETLGFISRQGTCFYVSSEDAEEFHAALQSAHYAEKKEAGYEREHRREVDAVIANGE